MNTIFFKLKKYLTSHFINKLMISYMVIVLIIVFTILSVIYNQLSQLTNKQIENYNYQILQTINNCINTECVNFTTAKLNLYETQTFTGNDPSTNYSFYDLLRDTDETQNPEYISAYNNLYNQLSPQLRYNESFVYNVFLIKNDFTWNMKFTRDNANIATTFSETINVLKNTNESTSNLVEFIPGFKTSTSYYYGIYDRFYDAAYNPVGFFVYILDTKEITDICDKFSDSILGPIYIISDNNEIIYDSSEENYGKVFSYNQNVSSKSSGSFTGDDSTFYYLKNENLGTTILAKVPNGAKYKNIINLEQQILVSVFIGIIAIILASYFITKPFSKRINSIIRAIEKIQLENITVQIPSDNANNDEISLISSSLKAMSIRIREYIDNEYISKLHEKEAILKQKAAELHALHMQIDPHFLYNTLEVIRMQALEEQQTTVSDMIKLLANIFRSNSNPCTEVTLNEELELCQAYLELISFRFTDTLSVNYELDENLLRCRIPKHLLQPIIENSIIHGIDRSRNDNLIKISIYSKDEEIYIEVYDNGQGISQNVLEKIQQNLLDNIEFRSNHIGIYNVNSRIKLIYGDSYGITINSVQNEYTSVILHIRALE